MKRYKQSEIEEIATILKNDGVISVPTDTVYGICARINSSKAYNNLVKVKNRPSTKSFPVLCKDLEQIKSIAILDKKALKLIKAFMPGPLTLVLNKRPDVFSYINNAGARETDEVAVRMIPSKFLNELIDKVGSPLFLTSANKSGMDVCRNLDEIEEECPTLDGMVIGDVSFGEASTIVDLTLGDIKIQRQGPISEDEIMKELNRYF
ncbi:MAG TPA: threonylcarbamoyl-AMP synthase [Candidatus Onthousia excrementipullorum]|uniref:L-threonylcarbamoyladenylate synthase n=1 Tax=Candidatus Onthousia excrementipullorum TaxID=2840884 RepID=A0A9D1J436_9FIRM|nr:threonylcarbamoyl-AMP synthase [Candidatus Onthousia excrementipullorum]